MSLEAQPNGTPHNETLSPADLVASCNDPRAELDIVQAEVARVSQTLKTLIDKTHVLRARINEMYSPAIRLLPIEITAEIFQACIATFNMDDVMDTHEFVPLLLGSVCSSWRRIAWSSPNLWSSLTLRLNTSNIHTQIMLLDEWLSRSGDLPLSIRLFSEEEIHWASSTTPGTAIEVIKKYSSRWRDLDLRLPTSCYKYLPSSDEHLPLLHSLNLNPPGGQGERRHKVDMSNSAKIQHLSLSCVYLISVKFQWIHVTDLRLEAFYVDECLEALRQTPQLQSCSLRNIIGGDDGHALPDVPLVLPALLDLSIENEKDTHIALLLDTILMPVVARFSYSGRSLVHGNSLCALLARSPALETVAIDQTVVGNEDAFMDLLDSIENVKNFTFSTRSSSTDHSPLDDAILRMCNPALVPHGKKCLLPRLEVLDYRGPQTFTWSVLLETLESRQSKAYNAPAADVNADTNDKLLCQAPKSDIGVPNAAKADLLTIPALRAAPQEQVSKVSEWQSVRLNLTHRLPDLPDLPGPEILLPRLQALETKVSVLLTGNNAEKTEQVIRTLL
ncbi:hypothetical protein BJ912DRAFT_896263 [Pholiota molesta]|nr:hypothetical protein BJ912DRAFT_896263 [Pholiota molesta]